MGFVRLTLEVPVRSHIISENSLFSDNSAESTEKRGQWGVTIAGSTDTRVPRGGLRHRCLPAEFADRDKGTIGRSDKGRRHALWDADCKAGGGIKSAADGPAEMDQRLTS